MTTEKKLRVAIAGQWEEVNSFAVETMGPAVGLVIGGVDVPVISGMMQNFDGGQLRMVGPVPRDYRIVVIKSANHFRA